MKEKLTPEGLVLYNTERHSTLRFSPEETKLLFKKEVAEDYPSPEVVHLEIANRCNLACPYCYVGAKTGKELTTGQWFQIIRRLANFGVFQITFGGGEPTMREDLVALAAFTRSCAVNLTMTTNGTRLATFTAEDLSHFNQVNVSLHSVNGQPLQSLDTALGILQDYKVPRGINFCLSKEYLSIVPDLIDIAKRREASVLFLTYKPVNGDYENQITPEEVFRIAESYKDAGVSIYADGLTCRTCYGSKRFCDIDSVGNVYICSFIRKPVGNVLQEDIYDIWNKRPKEVECPYGKSND